MASQMKFILALALIASLALAAVHAQDYDDESGNQGNDGYGGFSGSSGDDDYAAPRERNVGADGSDMNPGYHPQGEEAGNDNYENEDVAAAASEARPALSRANLVKMIKRSN